MIISITQNEICWTARVQLFDGSIVGFDYTHKPTPYQVDKDLARMFRIAMEGDDHEDYNLLHLR